MYHTTLSTVGATPNVQQVVGAGTGEIVGSDNNGGAATDVGDESTNIIHNNNNSNLFDISKLSVKQQQHLGYKLFKSQKDAKPASCKCRDTFTTSSWNGDNECVVIPKHRDDKGFKSYQHKSNYLEKFAELVGDSDDNHGAKRVCSVMAHKIPEPYT